MLTRQWIGVGVAGVFAGAALWGGVLPAGADSPVTTETELRAALADPSTTTVTLGASIDLVDCGPAGGDLDRTDTIVIDGAGFTIRQTCPGERVVQSSSGTLTLQDVTITGGDQSGTGIVLGGGVLAAGDLVLDGTTVTGNTVTSAGPFDPRGAFGGGVEADGAITLSASHVDGNTASSTAGSFGGGVLGGGGHDITIADSTVDGNTAETNDATRPRASAAGGGVALVADHTSSSLPDGAGTVHAIRSSVSENIAQAQAADQTFAVAGGVLAETVELMSSHVDANAVHSTATAEPPLQHGQDRAVGWAGGVFAYSNRTTPSGTLTAHRSTLDRNLVDAEGPPNVASWGAAVSFAMTLVDSSASDNQVVAGGTHGFADVGGLFARTMTLTRSIVAGNHVSGGDVALSGGIAADNAVLDATSISGNVVVSSDGNAYAGGAVIDGGEVRDSTISANSVTGTTAHAGGISHGEADNEGTSVLALMNSTVTGNLAIGATSASGGIEQGGVGPLSLLFSTVSHNSAATGANLGAMSNPAAITVFATTLSAPLGGGTNCDGSVLDDQGYTQVTDTSCGSAASADPQLGELADNGGPTMTMVPAPTSPLVDKIPTAACTARATADQRGTTRPQGSACDVGAIEVEVTPVYPPDDPPLTPPAGPDVSPNDAAAPIPVVAHPKLTG